MDTEHSAAGQALGYLYQCYLPLLQMAERAPTRPGLTLALELLDDVQFEEHGSPKELIQTKHHLDSNGSLADSSVDLWRTLNVWMTVLDRLGSDETPTFMLVTTGIAPEGSAASFLRASDRDPERAQAAIEAAAVASTNSTTADWRARFTRMSPASRSQLIQAITVADGSLTIDKIDAALRTALYWVLPSPEHAEAFIEHVKGWWFGIAIRLLRRDIPAYSATDILHAIQDIRDQFGPRDLPRDPDLPDPDEATAESFHARTFVRQLELIAATK